MGELSMRLVEWNVNGRSTHKKQAKASNFIFKKLMDHNPDVVVLTEFVSASYKDLEILLGQQDYSCFRSGNIGNEILIAIKKDKYDVFCSSALELEKNQPNYLSLTLKDLETGKKIVLGGVRITIGGSDLFQDFKSRRQQLNWLTDKLGKIELPALIVGDLNNGFYKPDEEQTFIGKPRQFYNYYLIKKQMQDNAVEVTTPANGKSWKYCRLDHCLSKHLKILSALYDDSFMDDPDYKYVVGYPDHSQLVVTYDF